MSNQTYEAISECKVVNLDNETVKTIKEGETVSGEFVLIDDQPYVETKDGYVSTDGLAEKVDESSSVDADKVEASVKSSNKKLILALVGAGAGYGIAHFMGKDMKWKIIFTLGGIVLGLGADYVTNKKTK